MLIRFLDENITRIERRHAMRTSPYQKEGNESGFTSFVQVAKELDTLLNLIWISGTREFVFSKWARG
jgi:Subunit 11 of the general transcription factor TFIIH